MKAVVLLQPGVAAALALLLRLTAWYPLRCSPALTISSIPGCSFWTSKKQTIFCLSSLHSPQSFWVFIWNGVVRSLPAAWKNKLLPLEELQDKIPWPVLCRRSGYMIIVMVLADLKIFVIFCFSRADLHPRGCNIRLAFFVKYWCWLFLLSTPYDGNICHSEEFILCTAFIQTTLAIILFEAFLMPGTFTVVTDSMGREHLIWFFAHHVCGRASLPRSGSWECPCPILASMRCLLLQQ